MTFNSVKHETIASFIENTLQKINSIQKDPEIYVYDYFEEIKRHVDMRRENLKLEIDDYSDELIQQINKIQSECRETAKQIKFVNSEIEELNEMLDEMNKYLDQPSNCIPVINLKEKIDSKLDHFKMNLTNQREYGFKFNDYEIENIFGNFFSDIKVTFFGFIYKIIIKNNF